MSILLIPWCSFTLGLFIIKLLYFFFLTASCVLRVVENLQHFITEVGNLPAGLKDRIAHLMAKRGLINDANISQVLYLYTYTCTHNGPFMQSCTK